MAREVPKHKIEEMTAIWAGSDVRTVRKVLAGEPVRGGMLAPRIRAAHDEVQKMIASLDGHSEQSSAAA